ncbi:hypothetical protein, partial [Bacillus sp. 7894-2]|uniref:hypothetical protein n=1 Tax=Bacillus sp. 7894-2 TaxID=2021695 RepID=UPI000BD45B74
MQLRTQKEKKGGLESEPGATSDTKRENGGLESEPGATSDTKREKERLRVRTRCNFGHKKH